MANDDAAAIARLKAELAAARARLAELEARIDVDPLLDVRNRQGFERELARSLAQIKRYGGEAALVYIDLDDFKAVNDRHGHAAGDALLKAVANQLSARVRASDVVGRLGGDELAVLMWNVDAAQAGIRALDLETIVAGVDVGRGAARLSVGASAGVVPLAGMDTPAQAIDAADKAMYARKRVKRGE